MGTGSGIVALNSGTLDWSNNTGTTRVNPGDSITLTATADSGSVFVGWSGACSGTGSCEVTMDSAKSVTATFALPVAGACGLSHKDTFTIAPSSNLCSPVSSPNLTPTSTGWTWTCSGQYGGLPADCYANIKIWPFSTNNPAHGSIVCPSSVNHGSNASCTITAADGYTLTAFTDNSAPVLESVVLGTYDINNVTGSHNLVATFSDISAPVLVISALPDLSTTSAPVINIAGSITDPSGLASFTINGIPASVHSGSFNQAIELAPGANTITITAADTIGNSTTSTRTITYNPTAPVISINSPVDNGTINLTLNPHITVNGTIDPAQTSTVDVRTNGGEPQAAGINGVDFSTSVNLIAGINTIEIIASGTGGTSSAKRTITAGTSLPALNITTPGQDGITVTTTPSVTVTLADATNALDLNLSSDGGATYNKLTDTPVTNGSYTVPVSLTSAIANHLLVTATDPLLSNQEQATARRDLIPETTGTAPAPWLSIPATADSKGKVYIIAGASPAQGAVYSFEYRIGTDGTWTPVYTGTLRNPTVTVAKGQNYYFRVKVKAPGYQDSGYTMGNQPCSISNAAIAPAWFSVPATSNTGSIYILAATSPTPGATYIFQYKKTTDSNWTTYNSGTTRNPTITGLTAGIWQFQVYVTANTYTQSATTTANNTCSISGPAAAPPWFSVSTTATGAKTAYVIAGTSSTPNARYNFQYRLQGSGSWTTSLTDSTTRNVYIQLPAPGIYEFQSYVTADGFTASTPTAGSNTCTVSSQAAAVPWFSVPATTTSNKLYVLAGTSPTPGVSYTFEYSTTGPGGPWTQIGTADGIRNQTLTLPASSGGATTYTFRVTNRGGGYTASNPKLGSNTVNW